MPTNVLGPKVPRNTSNYVVPNRIRGNFRPNCANGTLDTPVNLGSLEALEFTPAETVLDLSTAYDGPQAVDKQFVTTTGGTFTMQIHEWVGHNLNLLFRGKSAESRTVANGNAEVITDSVYVTLNGTTAVEIDGTALEYNRSANTVVKPNLTVVEVQGCEIVDGSTGKGTVYAASDYDLVQPTTNAASQLMSFNTGAAGQPLAGQTVTGSAWIQFTGGGPAGAVAAADEVSTPLVAAYTGGAGAIPVVGETFLEGGETFQITYVHPGATAVAGTIDFVNLTDVAGPLTANASAAVVGSFGFSATVGVGAATTLVATGANAAVTADTTIAGGTLLSNAAITASELAVGRVVVAGSGAAFASMATVALLDVVAFQEALPTATLDSFNLTNSTIGTIAGTLTLSATSGSFAAGDSLAATATMTSFTVVSTQAGESATGTTIARSAGSTIGDGDSVVVTYTYERDAVQVVSVLDGLLIEGQLEVSVLSSDGPQFLMRFFRTSLRQDGAMSINPEERMSPTLSFQILPRLSDGKRGEIAIFAGRPSFGVTTC